MEPSLVIWHLLNLIDYFLKGTEEKVVSAVNVGPRKPKFELVFPVKSMAVTKKLKVATVLSKEILKDKNYSHFELGFDGSKIVRRPIWK